MVFTTTTLFKGIACPKGEQCNLTNCIFSHDSPPQKTSTQASTSLSHNDNSSFEPPTKRRRVTYESAADKPPSRAEQIRAELASVRGAGAKPSGASPKETTSSNGGIHMSKPSLSSLTKAVTPPSTNGTATSSPKPSTSANNNKVNNASLHNGNAASSTTESNEMLNPRIVANDPAGHNKRSLYLKHLHSELVKQNKVVDEAVDLPHKHVLLLKERELIKLALDEEERAARESGTSYANVIKLRIAAYRKMKLHDWTNHLTSTFTKNNPNESKNKPVETGLTSEDEILILRHLVADQSQLVNHGYIPVPPTDEAAAEAAAAVEAANNFEKCERCSASFQVFPGRNEEGELTSRGPCKHHPNRLLRPQREKGDGASGIVKESIYPCCDGVQGSQGCTELEDHVFKASTPARMAAILPFVNTPENTNPAKDRHGRDVEAVTFDCEMGHTVFGLELIRLTAVSWPAGDPLLDILVRPLGAVIDLNSRFSGVFPGHFINAIPYDQYTPPPTDQKVEGNSTPLPIVENPQRARALLCSFLTPSTPLLGHAIDNDLNAVRLCHPTIVDTVVLYPHPRGLPFRFGLKMLTSKYLDRQIQTGGASGHDSLEDAVATGDLVRKHVGQKWKVLAAQGWEIEGGKLMPPERVKMEMENAGVSIGEEGEAGVDAMVAKALEEGGKAAGKKRRKLRSVDGAAGEATEDEEVPVGVGIAAYAMAMKEAEEGKRR